MAIPHCWEDGPRDDEGIGSSCMLLHGHDGPHDFVSDADITATFRCDSPLHDEADEAGE